MWGLGDETWRLGDLETSGPGDLAAWRLGDLDLETGDLGTLGGDLETWRLGDLETWRLGDLGTWGLGDLGTCGLGDELLHLYNVNVTREIKIYE